MSEIENDDQRRKKLFDLAKAHGLEPHSRHGIASLEAMLSEAEVPFEPRQERRVEAAPTHEAEKEAEKAAEREAELEAKRAAVERAPTLQEEDEAVRDGDPGKIVKVRITQKGQGRVQDGKLYNGKPGFYAADEVVEMNEASAMSNQAKGYVEIQ